MDAFYKKIRKQVSSIYQVIKNRIAPEDMIRIKAAYELARKAHATQNRNSGDPFITHPVAVARIVAEELQLGANSIIAAFLHDVVEDTPYEVEDIQKQFGKDVAFLVRVVTKEKKRTL